MAMRYPAGDRRLLRFALTVEFVAALALFLVICFGWGDALRVRAEEPPTLAPARLGPVAASELAGPFLMIRVNQDWDRVEGGTSPSATVQLTATDSLGHVKGTRTTTARADGWIDSVDLLLDTKRADLVPGDVVNASSSDGSRATARVVPMTGTVDAAANTIRGAIRGVAFPARVRAELRKVPGGPLKEGLTDDAGNYLLDFSPYDLLPSHDVLLWYIEPDGDAAGIARSSFKIWVDYFGDRVEGECEPGHTVWLTVTASDGATVKTTATGVTAGDPPKGGRVGFATDWNCPWAGLGPDILPGDWAYARLSSGEHSEVHVGTITGQPDVVHDRLSGTVSAPWFTGTLRASANVRVSGAPVREFPVDPQGGVYTCTFAPDWDLLPGQNVAVQYQEPDGDWVINVFHEPAPNLTLRKWVEGHGGGVAEGGLAIFGLQYWNQGDAPGEAILTDTLPAGTTYLTDSSGVEAHVEGGAVTWNLGTIAAHSWPEQFLLVVACDPGTGDQVVNVATIGALYEADWYDNRAEAGVHIAEGPPDLVVSQHVQPGDPCPGQLFDYVISIGNDGPAACGPVFLTDTLPLSTTLVRWRSEEEYGLWREASATGRQVVLSAAALPPGWSDRLFLTLRLDDTVPQGTALTNTVEANTPGEWDPRNNTAVHGGARASAPRVNAWTLQSWGGGSLAPGSELRYEVSLGNNGNSLAHAALLTDTLPPGTSFITAALDLGGGREAPYPPSRIVGRQLVWDLRDLAVNASQRFTLRLRIGADTPPGTPLTHCVAIGASEIDDYPFDDEECLARPVRASGANLSVVQSYTWQDTRHLAYTARIDNAGTTMAYSVTVTDTLPAALTLDSWYVKGGDGRDGRLVGNRILATIGRLEPGASAWLYVYGATPNAPNGTFFTNTVEVGALPREVDTSDNRATAVAATGPDLSIEKWLISGTPAPGAVLHFGLRFRNDSAFATTSHVWVSDTLPSLVEFLAARQRQCGGRYHCSREPGRTVGSTVAWDYGAMLPGSWNELEIIVQVKGTAPLGQTLTNTARIASDARADIDPHPANNAATWSVTRYGAFLPLLLRGR
jgi:uncharacterized repeat protein (TIGR01451 family)